MLKALKKRGSHTGESKASESPALTCTMLGGAEAAGVLSSWRELHGGESGRLTPGSKDKGDQRECSNNQL